MTVTKTALKMFKIIFVLGSPIIFLAILVVLELNYSQTIILLFMTKI